MRCCGGLSPKGRPSSRPWPGVRASNPAGAVSNRVQGGGRRESPEGGRIMRRRHTGTAPTLRLGRASGIFTLRRSARDGPACTGAGDRQWAFPALTSVFTARHQDGLPARTDGPERPPREGGLEVHIPTLPDATPGIEEGGSLRSRPPVLARRSRPGGRDATESRTTTCAVAEVHVRIAFSCTCPSISHVRLWNGIRAGANSTDRRLVRRRDSQQDLTPRRQWWRSRLSATLPLRRSCSPSSKGIE